MTVIVEINRGCWKEQQVIENSLEKKWNEISMLDLSVLQKICKNSMSGERKKALREPLLISLNTDVITW